MTKVKWIGALLFISMSTWIGFDWSNRLSQRPKQIRQLKNALQILEAEMLYSQMPLREAFNNISMQIPTPTNLFFYRLVKELDNNTINLHQVWSKSIEVFSDISALHESELDILNQFGRTLGQHDYEQQKKHIYLTLTHLDRELEEARDRHLKYGKLAKSLGVLCGLFIVLLLI